VSQECRTYLLRFVRYTDEKYKLMSTTESQNPSVTKAWQKAFGGHHTVVALWSHVVPVVLSILVWNLYSHAFAPFACKFRDDARLLSLWPLNPTYVGQLTGSHYSIANVCWLFAVTSTTSAIWLCWLLWRVGYEIFRRDVVFVPGGTKILLQRTAVMQLLIASILVLVVVVNGEGFHGDSRLYGLSLKGGIGGNVFKIVFLTQVSFFLNLGTLIELASLFLRYVFLGIRHRLLG
jgi:hypothetical protein